MTKEEILTNIALDFFEKEIKNLIQLKDGYQSIYSGFYSQQIGELFIANNISFESLFDLDYCKDMPPKDPFTKTYIKSCKLTPSSNFLKNILPKDFQKKILLDTISIIDWETNIFGFSKNNSIINIFIDFKNIGINLQLVNEEVIDIVKKYSKNTNIHANILVSYIYQNFFFDEQFMEHKFKKIYNKSFGSNPTDEASFEKIINHNKKNQIQFNFNELTEELDDCSVAKKTQTKIKI